MKRLCGTLFVLLICVAGVGFYRGWFSVSTHGTDAENHNVDVNLSVDTDKVKADAAAVKEKAVELTSEASSEASDLGDQAKEKLKND
ncbi:MAG TPA: hypothetical protein PLY87_20330 [Planctomycetaceae bacterium]|nr:hypothetical protein [Planctomycetaceae bacterium]HQZ67453.1 hypothetical protein [Planctomycetaceae bacterium]